MKIDRLEFKDQIRRWHLMPMTFSPLTLLVGASGVGKTQILKSILKLRAISRGLSANGSEWSVEFLSPNNDHYLWKGKCESRPEPFLQIRLQKDPGDDEEPETANIVYEELICNNATIMIRDPSGIVLQGTETVKLPQHKSAVYLLKEEELVAPVYNGFQRIVFHDHSRGPDTMSLIEIAGKLEKYRNLNQIRESRERIRTKLYLASRNAPDVFESIKDQFSEVFPYVEDVKFDPLSAADLPLPLKDVPFLHIKEKGVDAWIDEFSLSSGMERTLFHITELYLCADGTVILIDEFENSLGVNCIGEITNQIVDHNRTLQFIITSHHPYIINNVGQQNWKIVTRKAGVVTARDASEFNIGKSKHEAFIQLVNTDAYSEGVEL